MRKFGRKEQAHDLLSNASNKSRVFSTIDVEGGVKHHRLEQEIDGVA